MSTDGQTKLTEEEVNEMKLVFESIDTDASGLIDVAELRTAFEKLNIKIPGYKVRELVKRVDKNEDESVNWQEFQQLVFVLKKEGGVSFANMLRPRSGIEYHTGMTNASAEGTTHAVSRQEQMAFADWINKSLNKDEDCDRYLPIESGTNDIFIKVNDGVLMCKLINLAQSNTIDERVINRGASLSIFKKQENQTLALTSAESIGCCIVNIRADDLIKGKPHLVLGLLWQIIKVGLLGTINLHDCKQLCVLLREGESIEDLQSLSPEEILMRWVNYHMERAGTDRRCHNFSGDIMDSEIYLHLLSQISPQEAGVYAAPIFGVKDDKKRAELMLDEAAKIDCRAFVTAQDVVSGNSKLNLAFVANLFNNHPALDMKDYDGQEIDIQEDRDEKLSSDEDYSSSESDDDEDETDFDDEDESEDDGYGGRRMKIRRGDGVETYADDMMKKLDREVGEELFSAETAQDRNAEYGVGLFGDANGRLLGVEDGEFTLEADRVASLETVHFQLEAGVNEEGARMIPKEKRICSDMQINLKSEKRKGKKKRNQNGEGEEGENHLEEDESKKKKKRKKRRDSQTGEGEGEENELEGEDDLEENGSKKKKNKKKRRDSQAGEGEGEENELNEDGSKKKKKKRRESRQEDEENNTTENGEKKKRKRKKRGEDNAAENEKKGARSKRPSVANPMAYLTQDQLDDLAAETRACRGFRNWMNSLGLPRFVYYMYSDLNDGILLLHIYDQIKAQTVDWAKRVNMPPFKFGSNMKKIENCNYAVELGHKFKFSLVGIGGEDIANGTRTLTLALVWQMMRAYTLALLTKLNASGQPIAEREIVDWVNMKFQSAGLSQTLQSFKDRRLADSKIIVDLINVMRPNLVNYDFLAAEDTEEARLLNAKYALTVARKTGAHIYALPEDVVEVNYKMILTIFAGLMLVDQKASMNGSA